MAQGSTSSWMSLVSLINGVARNLRQSLTAMEPVSKKARMLPLVEIAGAWSAHKVQIEAEVQKCPGRKTKVLGPTD